MQTKRCPDCGETTALTEEFWHPNSSRNKDGVRGWQSYCRPCFNARNRAWYERNKTWRNKNIAASHRAAQLRSWGLNAEPTHCEICGVTADSPRNGGYSQGKVTAVRKGLALDHDHTTGASRGVLCAHCNRAIGLMDEDPELFAKAALYLQRWRGQVVIT